jgi:hypothetical protein
MSGTACIMAGALFLSFPYERYLVWFFALFLCSGIYTHLRSKQYQPFKQWQLYFFTVLVFEAFLVYEAPILAFITTLAAVWYFAFLPLAGSDLLEADEDRERVIATVIGGVNGLLAGWSVDRGLDLEKFGDRFLAGCGLLSVNGVAGVLGAMSGHWVVGIPLAVKRGKPWKVETAIIASGLVLLSAFSLALLQGDVELSSRIRNDQAAFELKNMTTCIENYFSDNRRYPDSLEDLNLAEAQSKIRFEYSTVPGKTGGYTLRAYHEKGSKVFMRRSGDTAMLFRDKKEMDDKFRPIY